LESDDETVPESSDDEDEGLVMKKTTPKVSFSPEVERAHRGRLIYAEDDEGKLGVDYDGRNDTF